MEQREGRIGIMGMIGPGLAIAVAGIGAGDVTATIWVGAEFGLGLLWLPVLVAAFKFVLTEGVARWQLATGQTLLDGFSANMHATCRYALAVYLAVWTPLAFGMLAKLTGVTARLMCQTLLHYEPSVLACSCACVVVAVAISWWGGYLFFERLMCVCAVLMFVLTIASAVVLLPATQPSFSFDWSAQSLEMVLVVFGGVGGTMSILLYGYWIRERGRAGDNDQRNWLRITRIDLVVSYAITAVFALCMITIANGTSATAQLTLRATDETKAGKLESVFDFVCTRAANELGLTGWWYEVYSVSFSVLLFATVASSLWALLQGTPYMCADVVGVLLRKPPSVIRRMTHARSAAYRGFLVVVAVVTLAATALIDPERLVAVAMIWGSLIIPGLAAILLYLNNRAGLSTCKNGFVSNAALVLCLASFLLLVARYLAHELLGW